MMKVAFLKVVHSLCFIRRRSVASNCAIQYDFQVAGSGWVIKLHVFCVRLRQVSYTYHAFWLVWFSGIL